MAANQSYSTFFLNGIRFGVPIEKVQEVLEYQEVTRVPLSPPLWPGIINLRGQIMTTVDTKVRLGLNSSESNGNPMMMVVRTSEGPMNLLVDRIGGVIDVDPGLFEKPTGTIKRAILDVTTYICKLEQHLMLVLDIEKLIQLSKDKNVAGKGAEQDLREPMASR